MCRLLHAWDNVLVGWLDAWAAGAFPVSLGLARSPSVPLSSLGPVAPHFPSLPLTSPHFHPLRAPQYTTQKSKKNTPERIEMKKYNKYLRRHTLHREIK